MTLESSKTLGGVGAILVVIGFLGFFAYGYTALLSLIGIIITLIALKGFSDHYNEAGIFNNALYGFITAIVGGVAFIATIIVMVLMAISNINIDWTNPTAVQQYFMDLNNLWSIIGTLIAALVVLFIFVIISAIFFRKSLTSLSTKSGEKIFETAGLLWLIGAILTIVLIGFILIGIAWILIAIGFFSIKTTATQPPTAPPQPPPQPP
jgi:uncharacterized membrane protein